MGRDTIDQLQPRQGSYLLEARSNHRTSNLWMQMLITATTPEIIILASFRIRQKQMLPEHLDLATLMSFQWKPLLKH